MGGHKIFKTGGHVPDQSPVEMVMFLFFFHRPDQGRAKRRKPENHIHIFQDIKPATHGFMSLLQIFAQCIYGQWGTDQFRQPQGQKFQLGKVGNRFNGRAFLVDQQGAILDGPSFCLNGGAGKKRFRVLRSWLLRSNVQVVQRFSVRTFFPLSSAVIA